VYNLKTRLPWNFFSAQLLRSITRQYKKIIT